MFHWASDMDIEPAEIREGSAELMFPGLFLAVRFVTTNNSGSIDQIRALTKDIKPIVREANVWTERAQRRVSR